MKGIQQAEAQADEIRQTAQREARDVVKAVEAAIAQQERAAAVCTHLIREAPDIAEANGRADRGHEAGSALPAGTQAPARSRQRDL